MKLFKNIILFGCLSLVAESCFNPPEFPVEPKIEFVDWYFKDSPDISDDDTLFVVVSFQDGDGDLGLASDDGGVNRYRLIGITEEDRLESYPFHENEFFVDDGTKLYPISELTPASVTPSMKITTKSASNRISLPDFYGFPGKCKNYVIDSALVSADLRTTLDDDMILDEYILSNNKSYYLIADTFYIEPNPRYYNFEIRFFTMVGEEEEEFNWETIFQPECGDNFFGRVPLLSEDDETTPKEGNIIYAMPSAGFSPMLGNRLFKVKILLHDRAGHVSNTVESPLNSLDQIER
ncbi:MAG TPA: hypothetical protein VD884_02050 [Ohtaekwangia sp.]|nr:hypothetical protein [Ohtaekwangia sp.]